MAVNRSISRLLNERRLLLASNRGPVAFDKDTVTEEITAQRGSGGLVTALSALADSRALWLASAMSPGDRIMASKDPSGKGYIQYADDSSFRLRYLRLEREVFDRYYNRISNQILWFLQHNMWDPPRSPLFNAGTESAWAGYREVNRRYAEALSEEVTNAEKAVAMIHDYHLMLVASHLRKEAPETFLYHFTHVPWTQPDGFKMLPGTMGSELLEAMLQHDLLGFHTRRWATNFLWCCQSILDADVDFKRGRVRFSGREVAVRSYPITIDTAELRSMAYSPEADRNVVRLNRLIDGRKVLLRVDRLDPSKNIVRGFLAYEAFLHEHPEFKERVVHLAMLNPSRRALPEYRTYEAEVVATAERIITELGTDDWDPILFSYDENYVQAIAAMRLYDVLMVNPIIDGMNLVAKEGVVLNEREGVLILSRNAGAWEELHGGSLGVNPYDIAEMAEAIYRALTMEREERVSRSAYLRDMVERSKPATWVAAQLADVERLERARRK